ncbi:hypothetical protein Q8A73_006338 [Channa argus]|nr:hypothetical protein Q8A73_006338 [Channa argus]
MLSLHTLSGAEREVLEEQNSGASVAPLSWEEQMEEMEGCEERRPSSPRWCKKYTCGMRRKQEGLVKSGDKGRVVGADFELDGTPFRAIVVYGSQARGSEEGDGRGFGPPLRHK